MINIPFRRVAAVICLAAGLAVGCEDPDNFFEPVNPDLAADAIVGTVGSTERITAGARRQLSLLMNDLVPPAEILSDNYVNTRTFFNQFLDDLAIDFTDQDIRELEFDIARLRELTTTGLNDIAPAEDGRSDDDVAELYFLRGMAYLIGAETFVALPAEPNGTPQPPSAHYALAIENFGQAMSTAAGSPAGQAARLARARAYYRLGDRTNAVADAQAAIDADSSLLYTAEFDAVNGPTNTMQDALFDRGTFDDLQPLPSLDFLDPKYNGATPNFDYPIPVVKIEEAHLILAEAALSQGNLDDAKAIMRDIVALVATRPTATFDDAVEGRTQLAPRSRPDTNTVSVAPGPNRMLISGLVLDRNDGLITVPTVSGTSITNDQIDAINDVDFAYEELYRLRQHIFISEGRRMIDLGFKFPISQRESDANPAVTADLNMGVIPSWLAGMDLDAFSYDAAAGTATVTNNLNRLTAQNRSSDLVVPFE